MKKKNNHNDEALSPKDFAYFHNYFLDTSLPHDQALQRRQFLFMSMKKNKVQKILDMLTHFHASEETLKCVKESFMENDAYGPFIS